MMMQKGQKILLKLLFMVFALSLKCCSFVGVFYLPGMVTLLGSAPKRRTVATSAQNLAILPRSVKSLTFATFATRKGTWQKTALMGTRRPATSVGARVTLHWSAQVRRQFQELKGKNSLGCGINLHERNPTFYTPGRICLTHNPSTFERFR